MPEEQVRVTLSARAQTFIAAFNASATAVGNLGKAAGAIKGQLDAVGARVDRLASRVKIGGIAIGAGLSLGVRQGVASLRTLEVGIKNIQTLGDTSLSVDRISKSIRGLALEVPQTADTLAQGLYNIQSSGFAGADSLNIMEVSARAATAGLTTTDVAAQAITQTLNAFGMGADQAGQISDIFFHTVNKGVLTFSELSNTVGDWASMAATLGVPVGEATAALASMTLAGTNANMASTQLATMMRAFINPSEKMSETVKSLGYSSAEAMVSEIGLTDSIMKVTGATDGSAQAIQELFIDVQGLNGVLQLTGAQQKNFVTLSDQMTSKTGVAGATTKAFNIQMASQAAKLQILKNTMAEFGMGIGTMVKPFMDAFIGSMTKIAEMGVGVTRFFNSLPGPIKMFAGALLFLSGPLVALGGLLLAFQLKSLLLRAALKGMAGATKNTMFAPLTAGLQRANQAWERFKHNLLKNPINTMVRPLKQAGTAVQAFARNLGSLRVGVHPFHQMSVEMKKARAEMGGLRGSLAGIGKGASASVGQLAGNFKRVGSAAMLAGAQVKRFSGLVRTGLSSAGSTIGSMLLPFGAVGAAIGVVHLATNGLTDDLNRASESAKEFSDNLTEGLDWSSFAEGQAAINEMSAEIDRLKTKAAGKQAGGFWGDLGQNAVGVLDVMDEVTMGFVELDNTLLDTQMQQQASGKEWQNMQANLDTAKAAVKGLQQQFGLTEAEAIKIAVELELDLTKPLDMSDLEAVRSALSSNSVDTSGADDVAAAFQTIADKASAAADKINAYRDIMDSVNGDTMDARDLQAQMGDNMRTFAATLLEVGGISDKTLDPMTEEGGRLQAAMSAVNDTGNEMAALAYEQGHGVEYATKQWALGTLGLLETAKAMDTSDAGMRALMATIDLTPEKMAAMLQIPGAGEVLTDVGLLQGTIGRMGLEAVKTEVSNGKLGESFDILGGQIYETSLSYMDEEEAQAAATLGSAQHANQLVKEGKAAGMADEDIRNMIRAMELTPEEINTVLGFEDGDIAFQEVKDLGQAIEDVPELEVTANTDPAQRAVEEIPKLVEEIPPVVWEPLTVDPAYLDSVSGIIGQRAGRILDIYHQKVADEGSAAAEDWLVRVSSHTNTFKKKMEEDWEEITATMAEAKITPEMMGIPAVQDSLVEASMDTETWQKLISNPVALQIHTAQALSDAGWTAGEILQIMDISPEVGILIDSAGAIVDIAEISTYVETMPDGTVRVKPDAVAALTELGVVSVTVENLDGTTASIPVNVTGNALSEAQSIVNTIAGIQGKTVAININRIERFTQTHGAADGAILNYAGGGLPKQARLQAPGTLVQWAEPETGGEAFIPLALAKRKRSLDIWRKTGAMLGQNMASYAQGGFLSMAKGGMIGSEWIDIITGGIKHEGAVVGAGSSMVGGTGLGAAISAAAGDAEAAQAEFDKVGAAYSKAAFAIGEANAAALMGSTENAEQYSEAVDQMIAAQEHLNELEINKENFMFESGDMNASDYINALNERLAAEEMYSSEWIAIQNDIEQVREDAQKHEEDIVDAQHASGEMSNERYVEYLRRRLSLLEAGTVEYYNMLSEISAIEDEIIAEQEEALAERERIQDAMFEVGDIGKDEYRAILEARLANEEKYSAEWMDIWNQIKDFAEEATEEQEEAAEAAKQLAEDLADAAADAAEGFRQFYDRIVDPIKAATSLISAFGDEASTSMADVAGFYEHQAEGVQRWSDALNALKAAGLDNDMLLELAEGGPESLGLAESILAMGAEGIAGINESEAAIDRITEQFGTQFTTGQVGATTISGDSYVLNIGDTTIELPATVGDVPITTAQAKSIVDKAFETFLEKIRVGTHR